MHLKHYTSDKLPEGHMTFVTSDDANELCDMLFDLEVEIVGLRADLKLPVPMLASGQVDIPWYQMPLGLRVLPRNKREYALRMYETQYGKYDWKKHFPH